MTEKRNDNGGFRKTSGGAGKKPYPKTGNRPKPYYQRKLVGHTGAQMGDYVIMTNGKRKVTTRINLMSHPFAKKDAGDRVSIKGEEWVLIHIIHQGTEEYHKVYDADTERDHFGY